MKSLREKISFIVTGMAYFLFHLRLGSTAAETAIGTAIQILTTLPYTAGFAYLIVIFIRHTADGQWPPWDRISRIFFTIGMIFGLLFALYERNEQAMKQNESPEPVSIEVPILLDDNRNERWYLA
ncbi:MAG: hypothetical protein OEV64_12875 [Desulfobulbaceae bacterium]|nr:hypothetical protein [Desulfobulbaceae bacterium]